MGGPDSSRKWALKNNLHALIKAKDILKLLERGEKIPESVMFACDKAINAPSLLVPSEKRAIQFQWMAFAEAGKLRGLRGWRETPPPQQ